MNRRRFLEGCTSGLTALFAAWSDEHAARVGSSHPPREIAADLVIVGGGLGGCAAALAALENNLRVIPDRTDRLDRRSIDRPGRAPDEHPWIEQLGREARYQKLRQGIRDHYRRHYPLTAEARLSPSAVRNTPGKLAAFQSRLTEQGAELAWPKVLPR